jgi:hypothetical protein
VLARSATLHIWRELMPDITDAVSGDADLRDAPAPTRYQTPPLSDMEMFTRWKSPIEASRPAGDTVISQTHA